MSMADKPRKKDRPRQKAQAPPKRAAKPSPAEPSPPLKKDGAEPSMNKETMPEAPAPAEATPPAKVEDPEPHWLRIGINLALLLVIAIEISIVYLAWPALAIVGKISGFIGSLGVLTWFLALFSSELKKKQKALLQSTRVTHYLMLLALSSTVAFAVSWPRVISPPPLLRVLPGNGVFNSVSQAVKGIGVRYVLQVEQNGRSLGAGEVTGAGSIYIGKDPKAQLTAIDEALADKQKAAMKDYLDIAADNDNEVVDKWMATGSNRFVTAALTKGCIELVLLYHADKSRELIRQKVNVGSKVQLVYLEDKHESCPR